MDDRSRMLGEYLKDRRARLDPAALGLPLVRRRTPGLRREEVAQGANISATWYTWLEQGRGGTPSAEVLERIAQALMLSDSEREHLFLLAFGSPPAARYERVDTISPRLQRILDKLDTSPAIIRNATWDIIAWNKAALATLTDYEKLQPRERNILRLVFANPRVRSAQSQWESVARFVVATFRAETARTGATQEVAALVDELRQSSADFARIWDENEVRTHGDGVKQLLHPDVGPITMEYMAFTVDGSPDLGLVVYSPVSERDEERVRSLLEALPE
ncbi:transcriptional regulator [Oceanidesulfovibrio marinus]|uniref:Transcriptional regulator n=2 Tax=Oceanidesulfovibrio marinus TaxID=370038 RepID=A0A6P1ZK00_9BACT|nr:transcriptional regulator [Oceanidesulfovibrio marinus]